MGTEEDNSGDVDRVISGAAFMYAGMMLSHLAERLAVMSPEDVQRLGMEMVLLGSGDITAAGLDEVHSRPLIELFDRVAWRFSVLDDGTADGGLRWWPER